MLLSLSMVSRFRYLMKVSLLKEHLPVSLSMNSSMRMEVSWLTMLLWLKSRKMAASGKRSVMEMRSSTVHA